MLLVLLKEKLLSIIMSGLSVPQGMDCKLCNKITVYKCELCIN